MALTRLRLFRGDTATKLVESFSGYTDLSVIVLAPDLVDVLAAGNDGGGLAVENIADGVNPQDAATVSQLPAALPPSGAAGGDLTGAYPNPTVAALHETSGPTQLVLNAIADGQLLKRSGPFIVGVAPPAGPFVPVQGVYAGNPVVIAANGGANLTWDALTFGTALLNLANPALPVFLATGTYAVSVVVAVDTAVIAAAAITATLSITDDVGTIDGDGRTGVVTLIGLSGTAKVTDLGQPLRLRMVNGGVLLPTTFHLQSAAIVRIA